MATVILAVAASGILMSFAAASSVQTQANRQVIASRLAADLLEEIAGMDYTDIKTAYVGKTITEAAGSLKDGTGNTINVTQNPGYAGLSRSVTGWLDTTTVSGVELIGLKVEVAYQGAVLVEVNTQIGDKYKH